MVARDNDSWEAISQRLSSPLETGEFYRFSIHLAISETLESLSRMTMKPTLYNKPLKLKIWGGTGYCSKKELLAESDAIINTEWKKVELFFNPKASYEFITLEAAVYKY